MSDVVAVIVVVVLAYLFLRLLEPEIGGRSMNHVITFFSQMALVRLDCARDRGDCHCWCHTISRANIGSVTIPASGLSCAGAWRRLDCQRLISTSAIASAIVAGSACPARVSQSELRHAPHPRKIVPSFVCVCRKSDRGTIPDRSSYLEERATRR
jgi:hypothetical protein